MVLLQWNSKTVYDIEKEFTFQYGSTSMKLVLQRSQARQSFTFQYGSTSMHLQIKKEEDDEQFTFQYGSTSMRIRRR